MMRRTARIVALTLAMVAATIGTVSNQAAADCGSIANTIETAGAASGRAFIGVYDSVIERKGFFLSHWDVEQPLMGGVAQGPLVLRSGTCFKVVLTPGERYLFSTGSSGRTVSATDSVAWLVGADDHSLTLAIFPNQDEVDLPGEVRVVSTVAEAMTVLGGLDLPPTDAEGRVGTANVSDLLIGVFVVSLIVLVLRGGARLESGANR